LAAEDKEREEEQVRKIAQLRTTLEKRVNELETEVDQLRALLDFVNSTLLEKGFRKPEITKAPAPTPVAEEAAPPTPTPASVAEESPQPSLEYVQATPIKAITGELLADLYMDDNSMRLIVASDKQFTVDTPPFMAFLVDRVLAKMQEKDREAASTGEIPPEQILSYEIVKEGDVIRELNIKNVGADRARELKSTIRWTLEKMYEKMRSTP